MTLLAMNQSRTLSPLGTMAGSGRSVSTEPTMKHLFGKIPCDPPSHGRLAPIKSPDPCVHIRP